MGPMPLGEPCSGQLQNSAVVYAWLQDGLGPRVSLFLSDVETDTWSEQQIQDVTAASGRVIVTLGEKGAILHENGNISKIPVTQVGLTGGCGTSPGLAGPVM